MKAFKLYRQVVLDEPWTTIYSFLGCKATVKYKYDPDSTEERRMEDGTIDTNTASIKVVTPLSEFEFQRFTPLVDREEDLAHAIMAEFLYRYDVNITEFTKWCELAPYIMTKMLNAGR